MNPTTCYGAYEFVVRSTMMCRTVRYGTHEIP